MRTFFIVLLMLFAFTTSAMADQFTEALKVCQGDPDPTARAACYEAVSKAQAPKDNPFMKALSRAAGETPKPKPEPTTPVTEEEAEKIRAETEKLIVEMDEEEKWKEAAKKFISVNVVKKNFSPADASIGRYSARLNLDLIFTADNLPKPSRAIKGTLVITDLFDEPQLRLHWTINEPMKPKGTVKHTGYGFKHNQFKASHGWVKNTDLQDMKFRYEVSEILYADETLWKVK